MFERFTEKARRVIFFARYEASQYGSKYIDTEHILLGFLKEEKGLLDSALGSNIEGQIRNEIENTITKDERLATPTEVPLSGDSKKILLYAAEQATEMRHHYIEPTHILLGAFMTKGSRAAQILARTGVTQEGLRQLIEKRSASHRDPLRSLPDGQGDQAIGPVKSLSLKQAEEMVIAFLASFKAGQWTDVIAYLADHARFIDAAGNRWAGHGELHAQFEQLS